MQVRNESQPRAVREISWRAQLRLCHATAARGTRSASEQDLHRHRSRTRRLHLGSGTPSHRTSRPDRPNKRRSPTHPHNHSDRNATREHDEGNPRKFYVGIEAMIPDFRQRQPRDVPMQCGSQPAYIRVIHRRHRLRASRSPVQSDTKPRSFVQTSARSRKIPLEPVDTRGPYQNLYVKSKPMVRG